MLRLGIVDFDSSHSIELTRRFNHVGLDSDQYVAGARVVAGWPGTSSMSPERIPGFTKQMEACGVELVESSEELIGRIDAVLVLSLCGQAHLERVQPFLEAGIAAYVDKPFACSLSDAERMIRLAEENNVVLFHSSALPFCEEIQNFLDRKSDWGQVHGLVSYGPAKRAEGNPGLFHYGIHPTSVLFAIMGAGCERVSTAFTDGVEVITACWKNGRVATLRGNRQGSTAYGFLAFCDNGVIHQPVSSRYSYRNLCRKMVESFESGTPAVSNTLALETTRFVLASLESEKHGGEFISLESIN